MSQPDSVGAAEVDPTRRFQLSDAMVLIAAMGAGLAVGRTALSGCYPLRPIPSAFRAFYAVECGHAAAFPCVASLSVGFLVLRLRRPRPHLSRVVRQPGFVAACTAIGCMVIGGVASATEGGRFSPSTFAFALSPFTGITVAAAWLVLRFNGWWRTEPGWLCGFGRALGICWMVLPLILLSSFLV